MRAVRLAAELDFVISPETKIFLQNIAILSAMLQEKGSGKNCCGLRLQIKPANPCDYWITWDC
jgi:hypothetical protein